MTDTPLSIVLAPVRPDKVMFVPLAKSQFAWRVVNNVFAANASGLSCPIALEVNIGTRSSMGLDPFATPSKSIFGCNIPAAEIRAPYSIEAATETGGAC